MLRLCGQDVVFCRVCSINRGRWQEGSATAPCRGGCGCFISPHFAGMLSARSRGGEQCRYYKRCGARFGAACAEVSLTYVPCSGDVRPYCAPCLAAHTSRCEACGGLACSCCNEEACLGCNQLLCDVCADDHVQYCESHARCAHLLPEALRAMPGLCPLPKCRGGRDCPLALPGRGLYTCANNPETKEAVANAAARRIRDRDGNNRKCIGCRAEPICGACGVWCANCRTLRCLRCVEDNGGPCCPTEE
jgi:hypothetical protein